MSDKCPHEEKNWERTPCGHNWCTKCQGWIDPGTRVGISAATPVVSCNRRPQPAKDYPLAFSEMSNGPSRLVTEFETAKRKRGVKRREWLARHDPLTSKNPYQDLRTKVGYDTAQKKCKEREVMYTHFVPPSAVLREKESLAGRVGADAPAVRKFTRSERYE